LATGLVAAAAVLGTVVATAPMAGAAVPATPSARAGIPATPKLNAAVPDRGIAPAAATPGYTEQLDASCFHAGDCLSVGEHFAGKASPVAYKWNGSKWGATGVPLPSGASAGWIGSVSCKTATASGCVAVGSYQHGSDYYGLAEYFNGNSWVAGHQPATVSGAYQVVLESVSCLNANDCVAAGYYSPASNKDFDYAIAEVWNGSSWRVSKAPSEPFSNLDTVSCLPSGTAISCVTGGLYENSTGDYVWAEKFDGAHWSSVSVPQPTTPNAHFQYISSVSCSSLTSCAVDGTSLNESYHTSGFVEELTGGAWHVSGVSWPSGQQSDLTAVSCTSPTYCIADGGIGAYATLTGGRAAFAIWNGSSWALHVAPAPKSGHGNVLFGVQCLSSTYCVLAGLEGTANTNSGVPLTGVFNSPNWLWELL
jgi:hypothetical protein